MTGLRRIFPSHSERNRIAVKLNLESLDLRCAPSSLMVDSGVALPSSSVSTHSSSQSSASTSTSKSHDHSKSNDHSTSNDTLTQLAAIQLDPAPSGSSDAGSAIVISSLPSAAYKKAKPSDGSSSSGSAPVVQVKTINTTTINAESSTGSTGGNTGDASSPAVIPSAQGLTSKSSSSLVANTHKGTPSTNAIHGSSSTTTSSHSNPLHATTGSLTGNQKVKTHGATVVSHTMDEGPQGANNPPVIEDFGASEQSEGMFEFTGTVIDANPAGLKVNFSGIPSLNGKSTTTDADGNFDCCFIVNTDGSDDGIAQAVTTDRQGLTSAPASYYVDAS